MKKTVGLIACALLSVYSCFCLPLHSAAAEETIEIFLGQESEKYTNEYLQDACQAESEEEALFVRELQSIINRTVERMSPQRSKIYRMSREEGLSNDEIAKRLDISKRTVENHLTAALAILRKVLYLFFLLHT